MHLRKPLDSRKNDIRIKKLSSPHEPKTDIFVEILGKSEISNATVILETKSYDFMTSLGFKRH